MRGQPQGGQGPGSSQCTCSGNHCGCFSDEARSREGCGLCVKRSEAGDHMLRSMWRPNIMADRRGLTLQRIKAEDGGCYQFLASAETPARTGVGKDTGFHGTWCHRSVMKHAGVIADRWEEEPRRTRGSLRYHSASYCTWTLVSGPILFPFSAYHSAGATSPCASKPVFVCVFWGFRLRSSCVSLKLRTGPCLLARL